MAKLGALYAAALYDLAFENGATAEFLEQAVFMRDILLDAEFMRILTHPKITAFEKHEFLRSALSGHVREEILGLLRLAVDKRREAFLVPAFNALISLIERLMKKTTAEVVSAEALDSEQTDSLKNLLSKKLDKSVELSHKLDPSVIGGPYVYVDGFYIDMTIKGRLRGFTDFIRDNTVQMKGRYGA